MKKVKLFIVMLFTMICVLNYNFVNAVEELPDNGAKISSSQIVQTKTGTGPFDEDDEPGNDSSEDNNIVRSFDQITWTIENTMAVNGDGAESYIGGKMHVKATLPKEYKGLMHWDMSSMGWAEGTGELSEDGMTFSAYYTMSKEEVTIPGKQTLNLVLKVDGATNGNVIAPEFEFWLNGNSDEDHKIVKSQDITVSSKPSYNIKLIKNGANKETTIIQDGKEVNGMVYGYCALLQLYNTNSSKGMRGIEYPKDDINFDIETQLLKYPNATGIEEDITDANTPILYNYSLNGNNDKKFHSDRKIPLFSPGSGYFQWPGGNRGSYLSTNKNALHGYMYKSGNFTCSQEDNMIHVNIKDYGFDGYFPKGFTYGFDVIYYPDNIGNFSSFLFQLFIPINNETTEEASTYYLKVNDNNFSSTSMSGDNVTEQQVINDDEAKSQFFTSQKGSYWVDHLVYNERADGVLHTSWGHGDGFVFKRQIINLNLILFQNPRNSPTRHAINGANVLIKFDDESFEPVEVDGKKFTCTKDMLNFDMYYAAKNDGTGWNDVQEQNNAKIEDLTYYRTLEELENDDKICVGALFESNSGSFAVPENEVGNIGDSIRLPVKVKDTANINSTYQYNSDVRMYTEVLDRDVESMIIDKNSYTTVPVYIQSRADYIKTEYNENGQIVTGTHYPNCGSGNSVLVVSAKSTISNTVTQVIADGSKKVNYDLGRNEYIVKYSLKPNLTSEYNTDELGDVTVRIQDKLPAKMTYVSGSSNYGDPEIVVNEDGTTTLTWYINNCRVNNKITPITFDVHIDEETANGTQLETVATIHAKEVDNRDEKRFRTSKCTIQVTNLSSHRLYKTVETPVIEKNGEIHFTLSYKNNTDETISDFQLLDILPYAGDGRGTNFTGTYKLDRLVVTQEDTNGNVLPNDNLSILYTNDENARVGITSKDENLGAGWNSLSSEIVKQNATAIALKGEIGAQRKVNIDIYLKTENNKGLDKYVNSATAQVYKATEEMVTSNVVSQVVERKIEGLVWNDANTNGVKDESEELFENIEITLTDNQGQQVTDVNGNIVSSVRTDVNGYYKFENLPKGKYYVKILMPNSKYTLTEQNVGDNSEINSKFEVEAKETEEITKLDSIDLPELTVSHVNAGLVKKPTKVVVNYKEDKTNNVLYEEQTIDGRIDDSYTAEDKLNEINASNGDKYEYVRVEGNTTGVMIEDTIYVTYYYQKKATNVKVLHVLEGTDVSNPENVTDVLYQTEEITGRVDDSYTTQNRLVEINANSKVQYDLVEDNVQNKTGNMALNTIYVIYEYRKAPARIIVHHYEKDTTISLNPDETLDGIVGEDYTTVDKLVEINNKFGNKYELVSEPVNKDGAYTREEQVITYYYQKKESIVEVNYLEVGTEKVLATQETFKGRIDDNYTTVNKLDEINTANENKYEFVETTGDATEGIYKLNKQVVNYYYQKKESTVEVNYLEIGTEKVLVKQEITTGRIDDNYTTVNKLDEINAVNGNKYEFVNTTGDPTEGVYKLNKQVVNYYYQKKEGIVEVNYLEVGTEKVLAKQEIKTGRIDDNYTTVNKLDEINTANENKYEFVETTGDATEGIYKLNKQVVNYYYQKKATNVKVLHVLEGTDVSNPESIIDVLYPTEEIKGRVDDVYSTQNKLTEINTSSKVQYDLVEDNVTNKAGNMTLNTIYVVYEYRKAPATIKIEHKDINTNEDLLNVETVNGIVGEDYTTTNKLVEINEKFENKYELVSEPDNKDGTYTREEQTITYYYQKKAANVKVLHVLEGTDVSNPENVTDVLYQTEEITGSVDDIYTTQNRLVEINANSKVQYDLVEDNVQNKTGNMALDTIYVVYEYRKAPAIVKIEHKVIDTKEDLLEVETVNGIVGEDYTTANKLTEINEKFENKYELVSEPDNKNGTYTREEQTITYYYQKKQANVVVKYVDVDTEEELIEGEKIIGKVDDEYETVDKIEEINETNKNKYILAKTTENTTGNMTLDAIEVVYYYKKVEAQVIIKHIDEKTGEEIADREYLGGFVGDEYTTNSKEIEGYELVEKKIPVNRDGIMTEETIEVVYYYSRIPEPVETGDIAVIALVVIAVICVAGITFVVIRNKKKKIK